MRNMCSSGQGSCSLLLRKAKHCAVDAEKSYFLSLFKAPRGTDILDHIVSLTLDQIFLKKAEEPPPVDGMTYYPKSVRSHPNT